MAKLNKVSYCHDCGTKIEWENFYCEKCLNENGLNKINIVVIAICCVQPLAALFVCTTYKKQLNPRIYKSSIYGLILFVVLTLGTAILGFLDGYFNIFSLVLK